MTPSQFKEMRYFLDMSIAEASQALGVSKSALKYYEDGSRAIPDGVARQLIEMRDLQLAAHVERDARRAIEDRFEDLVPQLYLGEVPDGWIGIVERLLADIEREVPAVCQDGESFGLGLKEKFGELRCSQFVDHHDDQAAKAFARWLQKRIEQAEREAEKTCARCGASGPAARVSFTRSGWILPLCERHKIMREGKL